MTTSQHIPECSNLHKHCYYNHRPNNPLIFCREVLDFLLCLSKTVKSDSFLLVTLLSPVEGGGGVLAGLQKIWLNVSMGRGMGNFILLLWCRWGGGYATDS
jgi:hypothetical protein